MPLRCRQTQTLLTPAEREALFLKGEGLTIAAIAARKGWSTEGVVRSLTSAARKLRARTLMPEQNATLRHE